MEERELSKKIRNLLQKLEEMIENGDSVDESNMKKEKLNKLLDEYYKSMK